jgi:ribosomal protein S6
MSYPIDKQTHGRYSVVVYSGKGGVVDEIERHFKISDDVIRFLTVAVPADYDYAKYQKQAGVFEEEARKAREYKEQKKRERQQQQDKIIISVIRHLLAIPSLKKKKAILGIIKELAEEYDDTEQEA